MVKFVGSQKEKDDALNHRTANIINNDPVIGDAYLSSRGDSFFVITNWKYLHFDPADPDNAKLVDFVSKTVIVDSVSESDKA